MITLFYAGRERVLLARLTGIVTSPDLEALDQATIEFASQNGPFHAICDFSSAESVAVPETKIRQRGSTHQMMPGQQRIIVVGTPEQEALARMFVAEQTHAGSEPSKIAWSLEAAFEWFEVTAGEFEPLKSGHR